VGPHGVGTDAASIPAGAAGIAPLRNGTASAGGFAELPSMTANDLGVFADGTAVYGARATPPAVQTTCSYWVRPMLDAEWTAGGPGCEGALKRHPGGRSGLYLISARVPRGMPPLPVVVHCEMPASGSAEGVPWMTLAKFVALAAPTPLTMDLRHFADYYRDGQWIHGESEGVPVLSGVADVPSAPDPLLLQEVPSPSHTVETRSHDWRLHGGGGIDTVELRQRCEKAGGTAVVDTVFTVAMQGFEPRAFRDASTYSGAAAERRRAGIRYTQSFNLEHASTLGRTRTIHERSWIATARRVLRDDTGTLGTAESFSPDEPTRFVLPLDGADNTAARAAARTPALARGIHGGGIATDSGAVEFGAGDPHGFATGRAGFAGGDHFTEDLADPALAMAPGFDPVNGTDLFVLPQALATYGRSDDPMRCTYLIREDPMAALRPSSCLDVLSLRGRAQAPSGLYHVWPAGVPVAERRPRAVVCDMAKDNLGGGFTLLAQFVQAPQTEVAAALSAVKFDAMFRRGTYIVDGRLPAPAFAGSPPNLNPGVAVAFSLPWPEHLPFATARPLELRQFCVRSGASAFERARVDLSFSMAPLSSSATRFVAYGLPGQDNVKLTNRITVANDAALTSMGTDSSTGTSLLRFPRSDVVEVSPIAAMYSASCLGDPDPPPKAWSFGGDPCPSDRRWPEMGITDPTPLITPGVTRSEAFESLPNFVNATFGSLAQDPETFGYDATRAMTCGYYVRDFPAPQLTAVTPPFLYPRGPANVTLWGSNLWFPGGNSTISVGGAACAVDESEDMTAGRVDCTIAAGEVIGAIGVPATVSLDAAPHELRMATVPPHATVTFSPLELLGATFLEGPAASHAVNLTAGDPPPTVIPGWLAMEGNFTVHAVHVARVSPASEAADPVLATVSVDPATGDLSVSAQALLGTAASATYNITVSIRQPAPYHVQHAGAAPHLISPAAADAAARAAAASPVWVTLDRVVLITVNVAASPPVPVVVSATPSVIGWCSAGPAVIVPVSIQGSDFGASGAELAQVTIAGQLCLSTTWFSPTLITCAINTGAVGAGGAVVVTTTVGGASLASGAGVPIVTVVATEANITSVTPTSAPIDTDPLVITIGFEGTVVDAVNRQPRANNATTQETPCPLFVCI
jgi:hypothetical protein